MSNDSDMVVQESMAELTRRKVFEDVIKRPYFHVKPLPSSQLQAWDSYVDYILKKEDAGAIVRLFERCLVACASYPGKLRPISPGLHYGNV
jgi:pre-mRNA-processing factor 39